MRLAPPRRRALDHIFLHCRLEMQAGVKTIDSVLTSSMPASAHKD